MDCGVPPLSGLGLRKGPSYEYYTHNTCKIVFALLVICICIYACELLILCCTSLELSRTYTDLISEIPCTYNLVWPILVLVLYNPAVCSSIAT